jgi:hypothetical protein
VGRRGRAWGVRRHQLGHCVSTSPRLWAQAHPGAVHQGVLWLLVSCGYPNLNMCVAVCLAMRNPLGGVYSHGVTRNPDQHRYEVAAMTGVGCEQFCWCKCLYGGVCLTP